MPSEIMIDAGRGYGIHVERTSTEFRVRSLFNGLPLTRLTHVLPADDAYEPDPLVGQPMLWHYIRAARSDIDLHRAR